jgi:holo-[acyl-carrier protein] synthase
LGGARVRAPAPLCRPWFRSAREEAKMIVGIGIDAVSVARTAGILGRFGERFVRRVFTEAEREYCEKRRDAAGSFAARFAAKEAVMKALNSGWGSGARFKEIEVKRGDRGAPFIVLHGGAREKAEALGLSRIFISLSHEGDLALAQAVAIKGEQETLKGTDS